MKATIDKLKKVTLNLINRGQANKSTGEEQEILNQIRKAHAEWQTAINLFNYSTDPDMVEYGIYNIEAAEKKYVCLLKRARKEKLSANRVFPKEMRPKYDSFK